MSGFVGWSGDLDLGKMRFQSLVFPLHPQLFEVESQAQEEQLCADVGLSVCEETPEGKVCFEQRKSPFHLNGAAHAQINASGRGDVLLGDGAQVGEGFVPLDFFGLIRVLCPAAQTAAGALATVLAAVPRRGNRLPRDKFRLFPAADKFASLGAQEAVVLRVVVHVLHPANLGTVLFGLLRFVVGRLHKAELTVAFKEKQVVQAFVASVSYDLLVARAMLPSPFVS